MKEFLKKNKIKIITITLITIFILCCIPPVDYNCKNKMKIVTPYGDTEPYHPKVLNFEKEWNGYKYWMSYTPYPKGDDSKENPCIAVSNDLVNWKSPTEKNEPLDVPEETIEMKIYNSDSHIVYNNDLDRIECYWRLVNDVKNEAVLYRLYTYDGINWSKKEISAISKDRQEHDYVSPAIIYENKTYKMWYIDKNNTLKYETSNDGLNWSEPIIIDFKYEDKKQKTWHLDVIKTDKGYEMITVAFDKWANHNNMNLYYSWSGNETEGWTAAKQILEPTTGTQYWDNRGIYRSCMIYENNTYIVFYSGTRQDLHHGIGIVYGKDIEKLKKVNTDFSNEKSKEKLIKSIEREGKM